MRLRILPTLLVCMPLLAACATNPVTGQTELSLIPEAQEIAIGQEATQQILGQMGLYDDEETQRYVSELGMAMAEVSERPQLPWKFYVLDDPLVNAFALPGGSIFVTRGILTHMSSEAELVSVLGHEIGHVTAKHSVSQMSKQQLAQLGLGLGTVLAPEIAPYADLASAGLGLLFLKFGRDDEKQSDELGFGYMVRQGYDPREMATMFRTLDAYGDQQGGGGIPEWASTHPAPENRVAATEMRVRQMSINPDALKVERGSFLAYLDGMTFGRDPRQGYFKENHFYHPDLAFELEFPGGWETVNQPSAVVAVSPGQDAMIQLTLVEKRDPRELADEFFEKNGLEAGRSSGAAINGLAAHRRYFRATTQNGVLAGLLTWITHGENTYQIASITPDAKLSGFSDEFAESTRSFKRVTNKAVLNVKPAKVSLVRADRDMSIEEFQKRYPSTIPIEQLALINGIEDGELIRMGQTVKRVQGGELP